MRDLRLIGVHDDGEHLVVIDDSTGEEFRLRIDEPLRAAARRDRPRLGQLQIAIDNNVRPREVQAMIRAGATADEVSARTGWDLDKIARFEGPVLAEREHVAERAQAVRMRGANQSGNPETLGDRSRSRFAGRGVESSSVQWDARRNEEGQWTVSASFIAGGRERTATWWFDVPGMSVVAKNDEAKWLSEAETPAGPVPSAVHRPTAVFDVEVEESRAERAHRTAPDDLINSMREHSGARGRRRGGRKRNRAAEDTPSEDALPFEAGDEHPPAARGLHAQDVAAKGTAATTASTRDAPSEDIPDAPSPAQDTAASPSPAEATEKASAPGLPTTQARQPAEPTPDTAKAPTAKDELATGDLTKGGATSEPENDASPDEQASTKPASDVTDEPQTSSPARDDDRPTRDTEPPATADAASQGTGAEHSDTQASPTDESDDPPSSDKKSKSGRGRGRKGGRASVPSWDDVMFGTTRD